MTSLAGRVAFDLNKRRGAAANLSTVQIVGRAFDGLRTGFLVPGLGLGLRPAPGLWPPRAITPSSRIRIASRVPPTQSVHACLVNGAAISAIAHASP